jgi:hypothetical protein
MKGKNLLLRIGGLVLAALLLTGVATTSGTVQAQGRFHRSGFRTRGFIGRGYRYGYPYWYYGAPYGYYSQYVFSSPEAADNQGYRDGLKTGSNDARRGQSYDPERSHYFREASFGNFAQDYRSSFSRGYSDGFRR